MEEIRIQESSIELQNGGKGKIAVFMYLGERDPVAVLDEAVSLYVETNPYNEFIDINMDNPWTRVVMSNINDMKQETFNPAKHKLRL